MKPATNTPESTPKMPRRTLVLLAVLILLTITTLYLYFTKFSTSPLAYELTSKQSTLVAQVKSLFNPKSASTDADSTPTPNPTGSPKPLPTGKQVYRYSHGKDVVGPKLQVVTVDPFDPQSGDTILVTAEIKHDSPVTTATAILVTDNKTVTKEMKKVSGEDTNGTWEAKLKLDDTYLYTYQLNFELASDTDSYQGGMTYRP